MKKTFEVLWMLIAIVGFLATVAGVLYLVYLWFFGVVTGLMSFGIPAVLGVVLIVLSYVFLRTAAALAFAIIGFWAGVWLLEWHWFWALSLYATTIAVFFVGVITTAVVVAIATVLSAFGR